MANIDEYIKQIQQARYGEEVRDSIVNALKKVNDDNNSYVAIKKEVVAAKDIVEEKAEIFDEKANAAKETLTALQASTQIANEAKSSLNNIISSAISTKKELEQAVLETGEVIARVDNAKSNLDKSITSAGKAELNLQRQIETSNQIKNQLDVGNSTAIELKKNLDMAINEANTAKVKLVEAINNAGNTAVENIKTAQNTATQAVETAKTEAVKAVQTEGTTQTGAVTAEGEKQVQAVQTAAQEIIADREQITKNKTEIADLRQNKADAIVETASGTLLNIKDSAERKNKGFGMSGKTTQDGTPTPDAPVEIVNAGRLNEDTGKYEVDAKVTGKNIVNIPDISADTPGGTILCRIVDNAVVSAQEKAVASSDVWHICFYSKDGKKQYFNGTETHKAITATPKNPIIKLEYRNVYITSGAYKGIMVEYGTVATKYEPYKEQTLTLTSDRPLTKWDRLVEQNGQIGWLYNTGEIMLSEIALWSVQKDNLLDNRTQRIYAFLDNAIKNQHCYATKYYSEEPSVSSIKHKDYECITICNGNYLTLKVDRNIGTTSEDYVNYFRENDDKVIYNSTDQEFVPLPQSEQEAIRALQTYYPTTVVSNSEDMEMKLSYVADTKNYTDRKIEEAVSAQTQNLANLLSLMPLSTQAAMIENDTNNILDMEVQK